MLEEAKVDFTHVSSVPEIKQIAAAFGGNSTTFAPPILVDGDAIVSQSSAVAMYGSPFFFGFFTRHVIY